MAFLVYLSQYSLQSILVVLGWNVLLSVSEFIFLLFSSREKMPAIYAVFLLSEKNADSPS